MANNTTWNFTGLPSGSTIMSYSPQIPGVNFALVNSDGVHTLLNAGGTPTQVGNFTSTIRVGTSSCYKDVQVTMNVSSNVTQPPQSCAIALANGTSKLGLRTYQSSDLKFLEFQMAQNIDITSSEYATFSFSYVSGLDLPGFNLRAVPITGTYWHAEPVSWNYAIPAGLAGQTIPTGVYSSVWRVTMTSTKTGCQASLDFPVEFAVVGVHTATPGGGVEGGA